MCRGEEFYVRFIEYSVGNYSFVDNWDSIEVDNWDNSEKYKDISIYLCLTIVGLLLVIGYQQIESLLEKIEGTDPFLFVGSLMAGICCIVFALHGNNKSVEGKYKPLYPDKRLLLKRKKDLKVVIKKLRAFPMLGITADWGLGKSVLVDKLLAHKQKNGWQIICIDALRFNSEALIVVVLSELQDVAWQNGRINTNIYGVLNVVKFPWHLESSIRFFNLEKPLSVCLEKFAEALNKLDKWIIINYEDLDRIRNIDVLRQLLALNELLIRKIVKLKIIYQYDAAKLAQMGLEQEYLEKYISHTVSLSKLGFSEVVEQVLENNLKLTAEASNVIS